MNSRLFHKHSDIPKDFKIYYRRDYRAKKNVFPRMNTYGEKYFKIAKEFVNNLVGDCNFNVVMLNAYNKYMKTNYDYSYWINHLKYRQVRKEFFQVCIRHHFKLKLLEMGKTNEHIINKVDKLVDILTTKIEDSESTNVNLPALVEKLTGLLDMYGGAWAGLDPRHNAEAPKAIFSQSYQLVESKPVKRLPAKEKYEDAEVIGEREE